MNDKINTSKIIKTVKIILLWVISFVSILSLGINKYIGEPFMQGNNILYVLAFIVLIVIGKKALEIEDKRVIIVSLISAVLISIIEVIGFFLENNIDLNILSESPQEKNKFIILLIGYFYIFYCFLANLFFYLQSKTFKSDTLKWKNRTNIYFLINWIIIFVCWLPYFFIYYPGILSPDSISQANQFLGIYKITNHHPVIHTLIFGSFLKFGVNINNINLGVALYSLFQMVTLSAMFSYSIHVMRKHNFHKICRIVSLTYYSIFPIHAYYSVTVWKDILFSGLFLMLITILVDIFLEEENYFKSYYKLLSFILVIFGVMTFRNNGFYIIILSLPVILLCMKEYRVPLIIVTSACVLLFAIYKGPVFAYLDVSEGSVAEALSIPLQQLARVVNEREEDLTKEELELIEQLLPVKQNMPTGDRFFIPLDDNIRNIGDLYDPLISDPVKDRFNERFYDRNKKEVIKTWANMFFKYPKEYFDAVLFISYGYWYPETDYWNVLYDVWDNNLGIEQDSFFPEAHDFLVDNGFDSPTHIPVISMIYSMGFAFIVSCIFAIILFLKRCYKQLLIFLPIFLLWLTCIASPVHAEFRYIYGLFTCLPIFIGFVLRTEVCEKNNYKRFRKRKKNDDIPEESDEQQQINPNVIPI